LIIKTLHATRDVGHVGRPRRHAHRHNASSIYTAEEKGFDIRLTDIDITQRISDENNDLKLTMLGGRLFQTLIIGSLEKVTKSVGENFLKRSVYTRSVMSVCVSAWPSHVTDVPGRVQVAMVSKPQTWLVIF